MSHQETIRAPAGLETVSALLEPAAIAIVGASDKSRWSAVAFANLTQGGFKGRVHLVNPKGAIVHGRQAARSCVEVGDTIDIGLVMAPASAVVDVITDLADAGAKAAVVLTAGFAETGAAGKALQERLRQVCAERRVSLLGPNCLGFINFANRAYVWTTPVMAPSSSAGVAIVSQSGATAYFLSTLAYQQDVGLSHVVSTGNEVDLDVATFVEHLITSHTELADLTAGFDAVRRLADAQLHRLLPDWAYVEPGVLWCGTMPGGLFRSADHGDSWEMIRSLWDHPKRKQWMGGGADGAGIHSIIVDPRDPACVWIAVSTGGIWFTEDAGATWAQRGEGMRADHVPPELTHDPIAQDVHCLTQCEAAPERMWVQHHNGIFVSSDFGRTFTEITGAEPSTFGFPVVVHPKDPDTAWFVPGIKDEKRIPRDGKLVVSRTRDGGKSFATLCDGLPRSHAYDVVYRHALAIDGTGDRLAFGSTTGGLWVSENAGDSWSMVSHTLPPVYAVRFA